MRESKPAENSRDIHPDKRKGSHSLPSGWRWIRLGESSNLNPSKREISELGGDLEVSFVPMSYVDETSGTIARQDVRKLKEVRKSYTYFKEGDILFAKITPCMENGKCVIAHKLTNGLGFGSTEFHVIRPDETITPEWVHAFLRQQSVRKTAKRFFTGAVGQQRVPEDFLKSLRIPLPFSDEKPDIDEQKRIVAKIEKLFEKLDRVKELRREAKEEAEELLQAALYQVFSKTEEKAWKWGRLDEYAEIIMGQSPPSETYNNRGEGLAFYQGKVDFGELHPRPRVYCVSPTRIAQPNDILISVRAPVGPVNVADTKCGIGRGIAAIRPNKGTENLYVYYWFRYLEDSWRGVGGTTIDAIRKRNLRGKTIPIPHSGGKPDLERQKRIVSYLNGISGKQRQLLISYEETERGIQEMRQAILSRAFRGQL